MFLLWGDNAKVHKKKSCGNEDITWVRHIPAFFSDVPGPFLNTVDSVRNKKCNWVEDSWKFLCMCCSKNNNFVSLRDKTVQFFGYC